MPHGVVIARISATSRVESAGSDEDRLLVVRHATRTLAILCDGAGNSGKGALAADLAIAELARIGEAGFTDWMSALLAVDQLVKAQAHGGECTCVVVEAFDSGEIRGASAGDSEAWMVSASGKVHDLTAQQSRMRLGSGEAYPVRFKAQLMGRLVIASDGLLKYMRAADIRTLAARGVDALVESVRLKTGGYQDDVAVILLQ